MAIIIDGDGNIHFPKRGPPPKITLTNYKVDPGDPYKFIADFPPCKYQKYELKVLPCGKRNGRWMCTKLNLSITPPICQACQYKEPPPA